MKVGSPAAIELTPEPFGCETVTAEMSSANLKPEGTRNGELIEVLEPFYLVVAAFD